MNVFCNVSGSVWAICSATVSLMDQNDLGRTIFGWIITQRSEKMCTTKSMMSRHITCKQGLIHVILIKKHGRTDCSERLASRLRTCSFFCCCCSYTCRPTYTKHIHEISASLAAIKQCQIGSIRSQNAKSITQTNWKQKNAKKAIECLPAVHGGRSYLKTNAV